jgi:polysaccharide pyruvyl transferase WcaK-like protein
MMKTIYNIRPKGMNVGNDAIAAAMQNFIYEASGELVNIITIPATNKYDGGGLYGLTKKSIHEINLYGSGVIVGGGNLYENGEIDIDIDALGALARPLMVFSVSVGKIYDRALQLSRRTDTISDSKLKALSDKADLNLLRDSASVEWVKVLGSKASLGACPTLFLNELEKRLPGLKSIGKKYKEYTLISVRNPELMNIPPPLKRETRKHIQEIVEMLTLEGKKVAILCHDSRDIAFAAGYDVPYIYTGEVYSYLSMIANCKLIITYRLHSFLPALSFSTPAIKISYDERALSLIEDVGYDKWNINLVTSNDVVGEVRDRMSRLGELDVLKNTNTDKWENIRQNLISSFSKFDKLMETKDY